MVPRGRGARRQTCLHPKAGWDHECKIEACDDNQSVSERWSQLKLVKLPTQGPKELFDHDGVDDAPETAAADNDADGSASAT